jgi:hypothetical protein
VEAISQDDGSFKPYLKFLENLAQNPNAAARKELWSWLGKDRFTITADGEFIGYKSVYKNKDGTYRATQNGPVIIDGRSVNGGLLKDAQKVGSVVEMPRSLTNDNNRQSCAAGLHVGTRTYASWFNGDTIMHVIVNPRDVVAVPANDISKLRTRRYVISAIYAKNEFKRNEKAIERNLKRPAPATKGKEVNKEMTRDEARREAAKLNIEGRGRMNKSQLLKAIEKATRAQFDVKTANRDALRKEAARRDIPGRGRMSADQLRRALR